MLKSSALELMLDNVFTHLFSSVNMKIFSHTYSCISEMNFINASALGGKKYFWRHQK